MRSCGLFVTEQSENNLRDTYVDTRKLFTTYECSSNGGDAGDESRPAESCSRPFLSSHEVDINYSVADEQFIGVIIVYHRFGRRWTTRNFPEIPTDRSLYRNPLFHFINNARTAARIINRAISLFPLHELIVEQGMFKLYYVPTFVPSYWQIFKNVLTSVRLAGGYSFPKINNCINRNLHRSSKKREISQRRNQ